MAARRYRNWWHCDFRFHGKRYRIKCPENNKRAAERYERILRQWLMHGLEIDNDIPLDEGALARELRKQQEEERTQIPSLTVFSEEFMQTYAKTNNKASTQQTKRYHLNCHLLPAFGHLRLDQIGTRDIEHLKAELLSDKSLSRKRVNNVIGTLSRILTYAAEIELIDRVPGIKRLKIDERQVVFLDFAPYEDLVEASRDFDPKWQVAIMLAGDAGLRLGEIRAIGAQHWDRWRGRITVERSLWENIESATKGWRRRTIPLTDRLQAALLEVEKADSKIRSRRYLFGPSQNKAPTDEVMNTRMEWIRDRAGIAGIGWHALRHTFCSHLAMLGVPARTIQELAGHADLRTTLQYMHLVEGETDRAISLLNDRPKRAQEQRDRAGSGHSEPEKAGSSPRGDGEE